MPGVELGFCLFWANSLPQSKVNENALNVYSAANGPTLRLGPSRLRFRRLIPASGASADCPGRPALRRGERERRSSPYRRATPGRTE